MEAMTPEEQFTQIRNFLNTVAEHQLRQESEIEKNTAAIRDLIVISRTVITSQKETEEKLHILIETVDRIIQDRKRD